ncbi:hypothetical protein FRC07_007039 [Ceratobasidium sp. 392]|nr:hypothetical protein FRC07_007039 [Ceratobasidium sp. 392]
MLGSFATALVLAASVSRIAASPISYVARNYKQDAGLLEDYTPYHIRYLALDCQDKHNTPFFDKCCHPLLRTQKLSDRPAECIPSPSASSSAALVEPTAAAVDEDPLPIEEECDPEQDPDDDDEECETEPATTVAPSTTPAYTPPPATTSSKKSEPAPEPTTTSSAAPEPTTTSVKPTSTPKPEPEPETTTSHRPTTTSSKEPEPTSEPDSGNSDACPSCESKNCLDLSRGAFAKLGDFNDGVLPIKWKLLD